MPSVGKYNSPFSPTATLLTGKVLLLFNTEAVFFRIETVLLFKSKT